jgi:hypothetical protein
MQLSEWPLKKQQEKLKKAIEEIEAGARSIGYRNTSVAVDIGWFAGPGWKAVEYHNSRERWYIVTAPNGQTFKASDEPDAPDLKMWLREETNYVKVLEAKLAEVNGKIRAERIEKQRTKPIAPGSNLGTCSVCLARIKLRKQPVPKLPILVLHGYKRPGIGYIEGNCPGVRFPPLELSTEGTEAYLRDDLERELVGLQRRSVALQKRLREPITKVHRNPKLLEKAEGGHRFEQDEYTPEHPEWETVERQFRQELESDLNDLNRGIEYTKAEIKTMKRRIADWVAKPLP